MLGRLAHQPAEQAHRLLAGADAARRRSRRLLDLAGTAPRTTPSRMMAPAPGVRLHAYSDASAPGPAVLLVPAPIKRAYIWDLEPDVSVVARCRAAGMRVFLAEWTDPGPEDEQRGLEEYADTLLQACMAAVAEETGSSRALLVGHSLGGTLGAILAGRRPELVAGLVLLEAPLHFGADAGAFAPLVAAAPPAGWLRPRSRAVAGSFLDLVSSVASPRSFRLERHLDLARSLADPRRAATHLRVERWTLDELAVPGRLFEDVVERLYRRDELMTGVLSVAGQRVTPASVRAPVLTVVDPWSDVVPPRSVLPFHERVGSTRKRVLDYRGDVGVALQHVGVLVGRTAHRELWPEVLRWMREVSGEHR